MFQSSSECVVKSRPIIVQTKGSINWAKNKLYQRGSSDWYIRLAHDGSPQRHINLKTPIKEEAARRAVSFKDTLRTLEKCLGHTEVKSIKLDVMAICCHKRLPRRHYSERHKHTLSDSDLRCVYSELGYELHSGNTMIKNLTNPPS